MKKILALMLTVSIILLAASPALAAKNKKNEDDDHSLRGYNGSYQYVQMGEYPYEKDGTVRPVLWKILAVEDGTALLLTENILDIQQGMNYHEEKKKKKYDYPAIESYATTDLCKWMNTEMITTLFGNDPLYYALMEEKDHGKLFCLTSQQFTKSSYGFTSNKKLSKKRIAVATPYALNREIYREKHINVKEGASPYWVATKTGDQRLQIVGYDGHLSAGYVHRDNIGVRPGVRLDMALIDIESGSGTKDVPFILKYTGEIPAEGPAEQAEEESVDQTETEELTDGEELPEQEGIPRPEDIGNTESAESEAAGEEPEGDTDTAAAREEGTVLVSFLGDCSIGDAYSVAGRASSYHAVVDREGYAWPFSLVQKYIGTDDMTVGNLEIVITTRTKHRNIVYPLRADPDHVNILTEGSIDVLNTANNHCYDFYRDGYADTLKALDDAGIDHFGCVNYTRKNGFDDVKVKDVNGIRFGFLGFTYPTDTDLKHAEKLIKQLREEEHCDYIVASLHWGRETYTTPGAGNVKYAKKMLDLGADMIYGHHPHVLQPVAFYNNKPILFSTGNCTFGTLSSSMDQHAGIFQITFEKTENGTVPRKLEVIPCKYYKTGDYRIEEETDETEREKTFRIISPGKELKGCVNPPESFLKTGVILFSEKGELIADQ